MAKRSLSAATITLSPFADTSALTDGLYCSAMTGGTATQRTNIIEVYLGGQSSSSAVTQTMFARDVVVAATVGATTTVDAPMDASTAALANPVNVGNFWTTKPQRSPSHHLLNLSFNAFGGIVRWVAAPGEEISIITATQPLGGCDLSAFSGGSGIVSSHIIYETF